MIHSTIQHSRVTILFSIQFLCATMWILGKQQQTIYTAFRFRLQGVDFSYTHSTAYCSSHKYLYNKNVLCMFSYIIFSKSTLFSYDYAEYYFCFKQKWCENSIFLYIESKRLWDVYFDTFMHTQQQKMEIFKFLSKKTEFRVMK